MKPVILFRQDSTNSEELKVVEKHFEVFTQRNEVPPDSLVIGRYSVLPFYKELEEDLSINDSKLINSFKQHHFIADLGNWVGRLQNLTPPTWTRLEDLPENTSFVLKGETNSKKNYWDTHMFAKDRCAAVDVYLRLKEDSLIENQQIYIREYVPLKTFLYGPHGLPITEEYRFFIFNKNIMGGGFYWSNYVDDLPEIPGAWNVPYTFLHNVINKVNINSFYVLDVAHKEGGLWMVVELNDGQQSGLSEVNPNTLYGNLSRELSG